MKRLQYSLVASTALGLIFSLGAPAQAEEDIPIRVGLADSVRQVSLRVSTSTPVEVLGNIGWQRLGHLSANTALQVDFNQGQIKVNIQSNNQTFKALRIGSTQQDGALVALNNAWYRGNLTLMPSSTRKGITVVNEVPLEHYLYSVVPSEMPSSWPLEALKSQAVAARTYAISSLGSYKNKGYDVVATTASQVYQGVKAESSLSTQAVAQTDGEIMKHGGKPIHAYFHSCSGGQTESGVDLWAPFAYLKSVPDYDQASPKHIWNTELSQSEVKAKLSNLGIRVGNILSLDPLKRTNSGRVKTMRVLGSQGQKSVDGAKLRMALGLNSTFFNVGAINANGELQKQPDANATPVSFQFAGRGWGHGMGMSQWGARQLALNGHAYRNILQHYYQGVQIERLNKTQFRMAYNP
ncbi:sporulation protein [bacterium (Candidatus Blackallbacteria) CG17_big_fil_post_rev_8_21_14_2_50_48_46]|uniref:Sporulation protein n=1 Tax=bacterium (Candidatus Blackallbacteria) CG17_big_fil_post_rev_8_21_14_2_50_48_46 TaxID=2014261 RepID=A0A2M7GB61_9BACT|nr:MAG: sporulation protein [bacterium (Candidatus Blackallbacteria) CG18_big_fil_WC_8_21_14_2_50_49_26]PIW19429.1 MAG: sporulation protein [bacterium (Candidatus Blackallbacteria) CG17_big_fil_post_rev_8_21_14_2_50_48_46]PIW48967.1 MAG: sporulation protein [bacterium (Candidatus Blackallbacteria) CG13_big_fil_rev_8_21_14_2_50_49_14]